MPAQTISGLLTGNFNFNCVVNSTDPLNGFSLKLGLSGNNSFTNHISFSGISGFLFDTEGSFVGGFQSGNDVNISGVVFPDRLLYYINNTLIKNNVSVSPEIDTIVFDKNNGGSLNIVFNEGFISQETRFLQSSDLFLLKGSDLKYLIT